MQILLDTLTKTGMIYVFQNNGLELCIPLLLLINNKLPNSFNYILSWWP